MFKDVDVFRDLFDFIIGEIDCLDGGLIID
jgi:hypothetical protein